MDYKDAIESLPSFIGSRPADAVALLSCDDDGKVKETITYPQLLQKMQQTAAWLSSQGIAQGDVVALAMGNSAELLITSWTCWSLGVVTVPLDMKRDTLEQHRYKIELTGAKLVLAQEHIAGLDAVVLPAQLPEAEGTHWKQGIQHRCLILFTSGTTARPKGAQLSLRNLVANAEGIKDWFAITARDRFLVALPLHHINSTTFCLATLLSGASIAIIPKYSASRFWQQAAATGSTFSSIVQTICYDQLSQLDKFEAVKDTLKLSRIQIGSAPVVPSDARSFVEKTGIKLYQGYGQTETALRVTGVPLSVSEQQYWTLLDANCIGSPMKWAEVCVMDADGKLLGEREDGEIVARGPIIMEGYLKGEQPFRDGWFLTGDIGYYELVDGQQFFYLKGRSKEIIIKGGVNISPVAVEDALKKDFPDIIDQAFVTGLPDQRFGEEIAASVVLKQGATLAALKDALVRGTAHLSHFETPRYLRSTTAAELPMTSTGKVQRSVMKKQFGIADFEAIDVVAATGGRTFIRLSSARPDLLKQALALYNHCWQPLTIDQETFGQMTRNGVVIAAVEGGKVRGLIAAVATARTEDELARMTYSAVTGNLSLSTHDAAGDKLVCVAICSDSFEPSEAPQTETPGVEEVQRYLESGKDLTYNFHQKPKGSGAGAELVRIIAQGRPEDKHSCGYTMLLRYPELGEVRISDGSVAVQLIEAAMLFAKERGIRLVYAYSRPAGLARGR